MALVTPIALPLTAFDSTTAQTVQFNVTSGDQVVKNRLTVRNNTTNEIVYQNTLETYSFTNVIPANTLENGIYYNFYINTYNSNNNISSNSNAIQFYCLSKPELNITNIPSSNIIDSASYNFEITYTQSQYELLNEMYLYLYDEDENLLQTSDVITSSFTPPLTLHYTFDGLENATHYYVKARATSVNGTLIETALLPFFVQYDYDTAFFRIAVTNECHDGCVKVESNLITIDGINNGGTFNNSQVFLANGATAEWNEGFQVYSNKLLVKKIWSPILRGKTTVLASEDGTSRIEVTYKRSMTNYYTVPKDYIEVKGYYNNTEYFLKRSNFIDIVNNNSQVATYLSINDDVIQVEMREIPTEGTALEWNSTSDTMWGFTSRLQWNTSDVSSAVNDINYITWNGMSNVEYNRITDMYFDDDEIIDEAITTEEYYVAPSSRYVITDVTIMNGVVDHFYISKDPTEEFTTTIPEWTSSTALSAPMNNSLAGGNTELVLDRINNIKVKRRLVGSFDWVIVANKTVTDITDLTFTYRDYSVPSGKDFEYAIVPCLDDEEQDYFSATLTTVFYGVFVSDIDETMKLISGVTYSQDNITQDIGILKPFNQVYPIITQNAKTNFRSLTVTGGILDSNNTFDADEIRTIKNAWTAFLTNGKPKLVKDWNGDIMIGKVTTPPSFSYQSDGGMVIPHLSFVLTEQGRYDSLDDLKLNGFIGS